MTMQQTAPLKCWLVCPDDGDGCSLILTESRGKALSYYADMCGMQFWEVLEARTRTKRVKMYDGIREHPDDLMESGYYLHAGCWTECDGCGRGIDRRSPDDWESFGIVLGMYGYCVPCAYKVVTGESFWDSEDQ